MEIEGLYYQLVVGLDSIPKWSEDFSSLAWFLKQMHWLLPELFQRYFTLDLTALAAGDLGFTTDKANPNLLVWPTVFFTTLFPGRGPQEGFNQRNLEGFDHLTELMAGVLEDNGISRLERFAVYKLLAEIRNQPQLLFDVEFTESVLQRPQGLETLHVLNEAARVAASRQELEILAEIEALKLMENPKSDRCAAVLAPAKPTKKRL